MLLSFTSGCDQASNRSRSVTKGPRKLRSAEDETLRLEPRRPIDVSGFHTVKLAVGSWDESASLEDIRQRFDQVGFRVIKELDAHLSNPKTSPMTLIDGLIMKAIYLNYEGESESAYEQLVEAREQAELTPELAQIAMSTIIYLQAVTALRIGENDNCIMCRGESSCILPIAESAVHTNANGSRKAIRHFLEYLEHFPDDVEARWLLNVAHMTLGEHPHKVDPRYVMSLDHYENSDADIGRFRDIGHLVGVNRLNQAGGAIMDDLDGDHLLDLVVTSFDPSQNLDIYRNLGNGKFENQTESAGLIGQLGGMNCMQTDFNNDGHLDIFVVRGAWLADPIRPSLLRNDGNCKFTDVTVEAGLHHPMNSIAAAWSDFDNDGWLDVIVCGERQPNRLYRNLGNGKFEDVASRAGVQLANRTDCKGAAWLDYDNDDVPDLYLAYLTPERGGMLFHNNRDGTFTDVTEQMQLVGPPVGFSCWSFDCNNDGWLDIFATSYDQTLGDVVKGLQATPHDRGSNRLFLNRGGKGFQDVARDAGLDMVFATMGSNYSDFDNDGYLDFYLGTGDPSYSTLVPNRMFKNVGGEQFVEVTGTSGTGHLQKGHGIACGDWDRDGNVDIFAQMGGVTDGDKFHNVLFQNPGHDHGWLTVKLVGQKTNRAAIGTRIKVVASGEQQLTVHRHVSSGSSFGCNPLEQTIGLGKAKRIESLEVHWPTSGTTQVFHDVPLNAYLEITEFAEDYRKLEIPSIELKPQP